MTVSIFSDPELIVTNLTPYLPAETDALVLGNTCSMRDAAFGYAYARGIPFTEIPTDILSNNTVQGNVTAVLQRLLARSEHIVLFCTDFSEVSQCAIQYCTTRSVSFTAFSLSRA